jgi:hypothetical protein
MTLTIMQFATDHRLEHHNVDEVDVLSTVRRVVEHAMEFKIGEDPMNDQHMNWGQMDCTALICKYKIEMRGGFISGMSPNPLLDSAP